jgi:hypothetical protein
MDKTDPFEGLPRRPMFKKTGTAANRSVNSKPVHKAPSVHAEPVHRPVLVHADDAVNSTEQRKAYRREWMKQRRLTMAGKPKPKPGKPRPGDDRLK